MKVLSLKSIKREVVGKGSARMLRRKGMVPAILYGYKIDSTKLAVELFELQRVIRSGKAAQNLINLDVDGLNKKVTIKEIQRKPVSSDVLHVDFYEVRMDRKMRVKIPLVTDGICKGVELGGLLQIIRHEIEVLCFPENIPNELSLDISKLDIGESLHVRDIVFPDGVESLSGDVDSTVLTILNQKSMSDETDNEEEDLAEEDEDSGVV